MPMPHAPVMLEETLQGLAIAPAGIYVDGTFGRGGHSWAILQRLGEAGRLLALDRDWDALESETAAALRSDQRFELIHGCFSQLRKAVAVRGWVGSIDGIVLDVGVSSPQLNDADRGFSFQKDGPLDMRMDVRSGITAAQWLAQVGEQELARVLFEYGEEKFAKSIAAAVVKSRLRSPLVTTGQLVELIERTVPYRETHKHPATRSFQAIRIAVNGELQELKQGLVQAVEILRPGGRLVVISFHSLEDRIVKRYFRDQSGGGGRHGKLPVLESDDKQIRLKKIGKALQASAAEVKANPRARSAVMRVAERI
jgi:16S rRNA (cytosine1402-N4)-methyltransferase